jgi:hypothetical protein
VITEHRQAIHGSTFDREWAEDLQLAIAGVE